MPTKLVMLNDHDDLVVPTHTTLVKVARPQRRGGLSPIIKSRDVYGDVWETGELLDYIAAHDCDATSARGEHTAIPRGSRS